MTGKKRYTTVGLYLYGVLTREQDGTHSVLFTHFRSGEFYSPDQPICGAGVCDLGPRGTEWLCARLLNAVVESSFVHTSSTTAIAHDLVH